MVLAQGSAADWRENSMNLSRILRVTLIALIFALVGPPIGGVTLLTMLAIVNMGPTTNPSDYITVVLFGLIYGAAFAYLFGTLPAVLVGLVMGIRQVYFGRVTGTEALGLGLVAGLIFMIVIIG